MARKNSISGLVSGPAPYKMSKEDVEREKRYRAQSDLETLTRAQEIKKSPERVREVKKYATEQMNTLKAVTKKT